MKRSFGGLPLQILALLVLPLLILVLAVAFGGVALHQSAMRDMVADHNLHAVQGAAASLSKQLALRQDILTHLAKRAQSGEPPEAIVQAAGDWLPLLFDKGVAFYDADGQLLAATREDFHHILPEEVLYGGVALLTQPDETALRVAVSVPLLPDGEGSVVGVTSSEALGLPTLLGGLHPDSTTAVYLKAPDGRLLYHSGSALTEGALPPAASGNGTGVAYAADASGEEVVVAYAVVPSTGWILVQEERWRASLGLLTRYSLAAPLVLVPALLIAAGAVWFGVRYIVQPLQRLENHATELTWGDFGSIEQPVGGIREIRQLQATLRHLAERIRATQEGMRSYIRAVTRAQEEERARLAHELHDQTAQSLVAIDHRAQALRRYLSTDPKAAQLLGELRTMISQAHSDLRHIIRAMRPPYLEELGLAPALETLAREMNQQGGTTVRFTLSGALQRLTPEQELALYRVAQEALHNALRHSAASHIELEVCFEDEAVTISVKDDGHGFAAPRRVTDLSAKGHFGIMGMYERAALIGAHLQIRSAPDQGTTVSIRLPLDVASPQWEDYNPDETGNEA